MGSIRHTMSILTRAFFVVALLCASALFVGVQYPPSNILSSIMDYGRTTPESVLFVGDVMLARHVEIRIDEIGRDRFFEKVRSLHEGSRHVVSNFEAALPLVHVPTPSMTFQFSVDPSLVPLLRDAGITHTSLANNHAFDHGEEGYHNAGQVLASAGLEAFGHPKLVGSTSASLLTLDERTVAVMGIHTVWTDPSREDIARELQSLSGMSDVQVVYVHWGEEYVGVHSASQKEFATFLVASGADIIIGHHPHVIQDIGLIEGVPVFYSLGNYVFDQYWNEEVRTGLAVRLSIERHAYVFDLVPIAIDRAQPRVMNAEESRTVLESLAKRSESSLATAIATGSFRTSR